MLFTAEVIPEMLEDRRKRRVDAEYGRLKARHFLSVCTTKCEQRKTTNKIRCLLQEQSSETISLSLRKLSRSFRIVPCTVFHDIPHSD